MNLFSLGDAWFTEILYSLWLSMCRVIYVFINWLYQVFEKVASVNLFSTEVFNEITGRMYIVMGVAMLFIFAYNLILMIINPEDKKSTGAMTKIVKETIISLVVVILLPTIFNYMYIFQSHVLESNIIGQVILGSVGASSWDISKCPADDNECRCDFSSFEELRNYTTAENQNWFWDGFSEDSVDVMGTLTDACLNYKSNSISDSQRGAYSVAPTIFSAFYRPATFDYNDCVNYLQNGSDDNITTDEEKKICANFYFDINMSKYTGNVKPFVADGYLKLTAANNEELVEFDWLFAIIAGIMAVWMFLCYAMEIGVRVAKLGLLQIISPIAVMMRVIPGQKEKIYAKWFDQLKNTYLDVFIRLVIIYFSLFAISLVPDVISTLFESAYSGDGNWFVKTLSLVIVILGILKFAQEAPKLIKDFFGSGGAFSLKSPAKQFGENKLAMRGMGAIGAGASSFAGNVMNMKRNVGKAKGIGKVGAAFRPLTGAAGGAVRGAKNSGDAKNLKELGAKIAEAKYATDAAQERGAIGGLKHRAKKFGEGVQGFGQFLTGEGATNFKLQAVEVSLSDIQKINANFKNGKIEGYEEAFRKMTEKYDMGEDLNFNGKSYRKVGNNWVNKEDSSDIIPNKTTADEKGMGDRIKAYFDDLKRAEFVKQYEENEKAFERLTNNMVGTLRDNFPKIGEDMIEGINKKLEGTGINFNNTEEITEKIDDLMKVVNDGNKSIDERLEAREQIYDINDALEKNLKNVKKEVVIAQQEKKDK